MSSIYIKDLQKSMGSLKMRISELNIPGGSIIGVIGENGAGKTTLLKMIAGLIRADKGKIEIFARDIYGLNIEYLQKIGSAFENSSFPEEMNIKQIEHFCSLIFKKWDEKIFDEIFRVTDLTKKSDDLSSGQRSLLFLAIAMAHHPEILILDEVLNGLDSIVKDEILRLLAEFIEDESHTVVISSHSTVDLEKNADYILYLVDGEVRFFKSIEEIRDEFFICDAEEFNSNGYDKSLVIGSKENEFSKEYLIKVNKDTCTLNINLRSATLEEIITYEGGIKNERAYL